LRAEGKTTAGHINLFGVCTAAILVIGSGVVFDSVQVLVRTWNEDYTTGLPSTVSLLFVYAVSLVGSVSAVMIGEHLSERDRD
jgi:hypothetical protein